MKSVVLRFPRSVRLAVAVAVLLLGSYGAYRLKASASCEATSFETVSSDKSHYALGETALITGSGFAPYCNLTVRVTRPDLSVVRGDGQNSPGSDEVATDATGGFSYAYVVTDVAGRWYNFDVVGSGGNITGDLFSAGPTVWTDKGDYKPGEPVTIGGLGFQPGETVMIQLHGVPTTDPDRSFPVVADGTGA